LPALLPPDNRTSPGGCNGSVQVAVALPDLPAKTAIKRGSKISNVLKKPSPELNVVPVVAQESEARALAYRYEGWPTLGMKELQGVCVVQIRENVSVVLHMWCLNVFG